MIEHQLIKLLLNKEAFEYLKDSVYDKIMPGELRGIYHTIVEAHSQFDHDLVLEEVKLLYFSSHTLSEAKKRVINIILEKVEQSEVLSTDVIKDVAAKLSKQKLAQEAVELLSPVILGKETDLEPAIEALTRQDFVNPKTVTTVTTALEELIPMSMPENRYEFALPTLQEKILGAGPGNLIIVFARPEIGKSLFLAHNDVGYLRQGLKVAYFGNEEPGWKIMMNHIRAATGLTDKELQDNFKKGVTSYEAWDNIRHNLHIFDCVGMRVSDVINNVRSTESDIVIIDQADKFQPKGEHQQLHTKLKSVYMEFREIAKREQVLVILASQASVEAENKRHLSYSMMDESKTGKAGEADVIIGIGHREVDGPYGRNLSISKNKISGNKDEIACQFIPETCQVLA